MIFNIYKHYKLLACIFAYVTSLLVVTNYSVSGFTDNSYDIFYILFLIVNINILFNLFIKDSLLLKATSTINYHKNLLCITIKEEILFILQIEFCILLASIRYLSFIPFIISTITFILLMINIKIMYILLLQFTKLIYIFLVVNFIIIAFHLVSRYSQYNFSVISILYQFDLRIILVLLVLFLINLFIFIITLEKVVISKKAKSYLLYTVTFLGILLTFKYINTDNSIIDFLKIFGENPDLAYIEYKKVTFIYALTFILYFPIIKAFLNFNENYISILSFKSTSITNLNQKIYKYLTAIAIISTTKYLFIILVINIIYFDISHTNNIMLYYLYETIIIIFITLIIANISFDNNNTNSIILFILILFQVLKIYYLNNWYLILITLILLFSFTSYTKKLR
ncbi:hypothetical protein [Mycoplasma sp. P36-A1]|uniref:hypothetical protein n=1 Tax=Mycoplasma sp. P36-A1 TaxID=3252900 RepID=UPI003C2F1DFC